jgi:hypothetical protein
MTPVFWAASGVNAPRSKAPANNLGAKGMANQRIASSLGAILATKVAEQE